MDLKIIGNRIKFIRINSLNLSQEGFADKLGLSRAYISRVESGKQNITLESLIKICAGLNITLRDFFDVEKIDF